MRSTLRLVLLGVATAGLLAAPASADDNDVPYWASLRSSEINMRVGPSPDFPIEWVYRRSGLPIKVVRLMQGWRLVVDPAGAKGWMVASLLSRDRTAIVTGRALAEMREEPSPNSRLKWKVEPGVTGSLGDCEKGWCELDVKGRKGWIRADRLWGDGPP